MRNVEPSSLVPPGFVVVSADEDRTGVVLSVRSGRDERFMSQVRDNLGESIAVILDDLRICLCRVG